MWFPSKVGEELCRLCTNLTKQYQMSMSSYDEEACRWQTSETRKPPLIFSPKGMVRLQTTRVSSGRVSFNSIKNFCRFSLYVSIQPEYLQKTRIQTHVLSYMARSCLLVNLNYIRLDFGQVTSTGLTLKYPTRRSWQWLHLVSIHGGSLPGCSACSPSRRASQSRSGPGGGRTETAEPLGTAFHCAFDSDSLLPPDSLAQSSSHP